MKPTRNLVVHFLTGNKADWQTREVPHIACGRAGRRGTREREKVTCRFCRELMPLLPATQVQP